PVWGTPQYMAPEQLRGLWREYGPWTDLYSLGCMAYQLLCGKYPFQGRSVWEIGKAHLIKPIPALEPKISVPEGFEEWMVRMLQKERYYRFQSAADAAWALRQLPGLEVEGGDESCRGSAELVDSADLIDHGEPFTVLLSHFAEASTIKTATRTVDLKEWFTADSIMESPEVRQAPWGMPGMPPIPQSWRPSRPGHRSPHLLGTGLGLY
ncbi:MAG: serine/threonine protein kinase, partial [Bradymonadaceae bacterium]